MSDDREDRIRKRAYDLWERDGAPEGHQHAHWQQAEREIDAEAAQSPAGSQDPQGDTAAKPAKPVRARAPRKTAAKTASDKPAAPRKSRVT